MRLLPQAWDKIALFEISVQNGGLRHSIDGTGRRVDSEGI